MVTGCSSFICICMSCPRRDNKSVTEVSCAVSISRVVDGNNVLLPMFAPRIDIIELLDGDGVFGGKMVDDDDDDDDDGTTL